MNIKRGLMERLRGWSPEEPKLNRTVNASNAKTDNPQAQDPFKVYKRINRNNNLTLLLLFIGLPLNLLIFGHYFTPINLAATIVSGVSVGAIVGLTPLYREMKILDKQNTSNIKLSTAVLSILLIADICLVLGVVIGQGGLHINEFQLTVIIFCGTSALIGMAGKPLLFAAWERKKKIEIRQGEGFRILSAPKSSSMLKLAAEQRKVGS